VFIDPDEELLTETDVLGGLRQLRKDIVEMCDGKEDVAFDNILVNLQTVLILGAACRQFYELQQ
jgi:hypothetical protein